MCFHAQQCAEKYLKALLALHAVPFPKTHDLPELLLGIPQNVSVRLRPPDVAVLNRYSIEGRYPGDWEPITRWTLNRQWSQLDVSVTPSGSTSKASGSPKLRGQVLQSNTTTSRPPSNQSLRRPPG